MRKTSVFTFSHYVRSQTQKSEGIHIRFWSTLLPSLKLFERSEDEGGRGDDDDEEGEEGGDLRGTLIKNSWRLSGGQTLTDE